MRPFLSRPAPLAAAVLSLCVASCAPSEGQERAPAGSRPKEYDRAFEAGLKQYLLARAHGLDPAKPGTGRGPICNNRLFELYENVFYVPEELEPLMATREGAAHLRYLAMHASQDEARALAVACLRIADSKHKLRYPGVTQLMEPFRARFVRYHYD